jgi:predicted  nucleic acid-binding Zn-ribbon protein
MDAYQQKIRAQIKEMKAKMQMLEAGAEKSSADMRIKYQQELSNWKSRFKDIEKELDKLSNSAESAWDDVRSSIDTSMKDLRDSIENFTKQFNS